MSSPTAKPLVINWHLTEACNYHCSYCYAAWDESPCPRELIHHPDKTLALLDELYRFFKPGNETNPISRTLSWNSIRLNFAGGEPLLLAKKLPDIISQAYQIGFDVSLISNGSHLTTDLADRIANNISWLGISLDSTIASTNLEIGRSDRFAKLLNLDGLASTIDNLRKNNPQLRLKINTVVNKLNHSEYMGDYIKKLSPEKWKILRMLPVIDDSLAVSDLQFENFVERHNGFESIICPEKNEEMCNSYIMVDPYGRFFQNSAIAVGQKGYEYSQPILGVGADKAFREIQFSTSKFTSRYSHQDEGGRS